MTQAELDKELKRLVKEDKLTEGAIDGSVTLTPDGWVKGMIKLVGVDLLISLDFTLCRLNEEAEALVINMLNGLEGLKMVCGLAGIIGNPPKDVIAEPIADLVGSFSKLVALGHIAPECEDRFRHNIDEDLAHLGWSIAELTA